MLEYIKSSIEILMNMKMDEQKPAKSSGKTFKAGHGSDDDLLSVGSSV